jgi:hypothetical protein
MFAITPGKHLRPFRRISNARVLTTASFRAYGNSQNFGLTYSIVLPVSNDNADRALFNPPVKFPQRGIRLPALTDIANNPESPLANPTINRTSVIRAQKTSPFNAPHSYLSSRSPAPTVHTPPTDSFIVISVDVPLLRPTPCVLPPCSRILSCARFDHCTTRFWRKLIPRSPY